jgi:uncharacterized membrane protein YfcA
MVNSIAGLLGSRFAAHDLPDAMYLYVACALAGALVGTWLGTRKLRIRAPSSCTLAIVMTIAGLKLIARAF